MRISDWSSDVCSSDLLRNDNGPVFFSRSLPRPPTEEIQRKISGNAKASDQDQATKPPHRLKPASYHRASSFPRRRKSLFHPKFQIRDRKSVVSGKSVSVRVDLGGRRIIKKKNNKKTNQNR